MTDKLRTLVLSKIKYINEDIQESITLGNYISVKELYKQKRDIVRLYIDYKRLCLTENKTCDILKE